MLNKIGLIGVPSSAGSHYCGQEKAPQALRRCGLVNDLQRRGVEVHDFGDLPLALYQPRSPDRTQQNLNRVVEVARRVAEQVDAVLQQQLIPLVIGGDCTITLGVLSGYLRHGENPGLFYFDGGIDMNIPETTRSGILDAMGVAHMLGEGAPTLSHLGPRFPLLQEDHLALFGYHPEVIDEREWDVFQRYQILHYPVTSFHGQSVQMAQYAMSCLEQRVDTVLVHFDVDVIDSADCPLANFPFHNLGMSLSEVLRCLNIFCSSPKCAGLILTELNPDHDGDGTLVASFTHLLVEALAETHPA